MGMFQIDFDQKSWDLINRISASGTMWTQLVIEQTGNELAEIAKEYMKPLMHVRPVTTHRAEDDLRSEVTFTGNGFEIGFFSDFYVNYTDIGSPFTTMWADTYGYLAFPVDRRLGMTSPKARISGVGQGTSPYASELPNHFSDKTAKYLQEEWAADLALQKAMEWIDWTVMK